MQIEEAFRDLKSNAYGVALRHNRTRCTKRLDTQFLIVLLAEILEWWNGLIVIQTIRHLTAKPTALKKPSSIHT
ncbi:hypothetical protein [Vibrio crassostreae]|uniref:hypothetical protein n=1 Tax=Vibrio crassostreae TaxID=246167 RepID=UPI003C7B1E4D